MDQEIPGGMSREPQAGTLIRLRGLFPSLKTALKKVAELILRQPEMAIYASVNEVAAAATVSEATVMRFCRTLGFKGFQDFKIALAREMVAPVESLPEEVSEGDSPPTVVRKVFQANAAALHDTLEILDLAAMEQTARLLLSAHKIMLIGVGGSASIVTYAESKFFRLGLSVHGCTDARLMLMAAALLTPEDLVITVSHTGATREVLDAVSLAREAGAKVISLTNNSLAPLAQVSDLVLVTAARDLRQEGMTSRLCQVSIIDSLFTLMLLAPGKGRENLAKTEKVISRQY
jgi:RpiR family transcriptional regulator, carbohydrate utilization regulator